MLGNPRHRGLRTCTGPIERGACGTARCIFLPEPASTPPCQRRVQRRFSQGVPHLVAMTIERWLPAVALAVFGALAVAPAGAQSDDELRPVMDRLDRLERDVNLLQRQVYRGGGTGVTAPQAGAAASAGSAIDVEVRLGRLEEQVRGLTGQIEDTTYKIQQLNQRLDRLQTDLDFRLNQLEHPGSAPAAPPSESAAPAPSGSPGRAALAPAPATPPAPDSSSGAPIRLRPPEIG